MVKTGKFIVIEGSDGSGKTTQLDILEKRFRKELGKSVVKFDFPQYDGFFGKLVGEYLSGKFGTLDQIDPHLSSIIYALDRWSVKAKIEKYLSSGKIVLSNRYYLSNMAHQSGRLPGSKRVAFMSFLKELELKQFKIPVDDLTIYLYVPIKISKKLIDMKGERKYIGGKKKDLHEASQRHLVQASKMYELLSKKYSRIKKINCVDRKGVLKSTDTINNEIWGEVIKIL